MYLAKVAMDIVAKHIPADGDGVRIAALDEQSYRRLLWNHQPLTDFWRVGKGIASRLNRNGMYTMGDVARRSLQDEDQLYKLFGVNAELLIDHAWGKESTLISDIRSYKPQSSSVGQGQVLMSAYEVDKARLIVKEMADALALDLTSRNLVSDCIGLHIGYDASNKASKTTKDWYGRAVPVAAKGTARLKFKTCSGQLIRQAAVSLFDQIVDPSLTVRRVDISAGDVEDRFAYANKHEVVQLDLFSQAEVDDHLKQASEKDVKAQEAMLEIKKRFGKNAVMTAKNLEEGATARQRNQQIGGHKA
jgi:DNA polymerase V